MRRLCTHIFLGFILCAGAPAALAAGDNASGKELMQRAEQLLKDYKDSDALELYEQVLVASPENYEALCRASYLHCRIGDRFSDETSKLQHFLKAKEYAMQAYELKPADAESNYVMALSLGCHAMASSARNRLQGIHQIKSFVDVALAANPQHAGAWHILGRWHFKMANLNFAERAASSMLFGGVCGESTNEKAAYALEQAIANNPTNMRYYYDLAIVYDEMNDTNACINTLQNALQVTSYTKEDLELSRRCNIMLQDKLKS